MKKTFTLLLLTLTCSFSSWSQIRVAILGGPSSSSIQETNQLPDWKTDKEPFFKNRSGLHLGFLLSVPLNQSQTIFFQPAFLYSTKGNKYYKQNDTSFYKPVDSVFYSNDFFTNYIEVPLNLAYRLKLGKKAGFLVSAGPYVGFFYSGKETSSTRSFKRDLNAVPDTELETTVKTINNEKNLEVGNAENKIKTLDFGYNIRAGFDIGNVLLTGFYSEGLSSFYQASYPGEFKNKVIGASLGIWLNKLAEPKVSDKDGDGVNDKTDKCPEVPGLAKYLGCPATDDDQDGVPDEVDQCPGVAGPAKYNGCPVPDTDGDGVNDEADKCPAIAGSPKFAGCPVPDNDNDGVDDENDKCPTEKGVAKYQGCPIPDTDGDGINDEMDKCPAEKGTAANSGCPEIRKEIVDKVNYAAKHILFQTGSDVITTESFGPLNEVATILKSDPGLELRIDGHSDNVGVPSANLALSQKRANAVKKYLVAKGIESNRLSATGFGQQQPVADNSTRAGQRINRRVEMRLIKN
jgi:outer membrane protein OmpA-like peptidoglycan-associated protein